MILKGGSLREWYEMRESNVCRFLYGGKKSKVRIILDNHSALIFKEIRTYLLSVSNRFEFVFTPKHGSWLNIIESFFETMTRTTLREIRVSSKKDLEDRIMKYIDEINSDPVVFRWKYKIDFLSAT